MLVEIFRQHFLRIKKMTKIITTLLIVYRDSSNNQIIKTILDLCPTKLFTIRYHASYFLLLKKLADDQCSSITKGSIYHINHMNIQPFITVVDWPETWCLMEVSAMFYICRYCVCTWDGRPALSMLDVYIDCKGYYYKWW